MKKLGNFSCKMTPKISTIKPGLSSNLYQLFRSNKLLNILRSSYVIGVHIFRAINFENNHVKVASGSDGQFRIRLLISCH